MIRPVYTNKLRDLIHLAPATANERLLALFDKLEEEPSEYGFEFVTDDDHFGNEGSRDHYYLFALPAERCPKGFTSRVCIEAPDDGTPDDANYVQFIGVVVSDTGEELFNSREGGDEFFSCVADCIAWLEKHLGWSIPKINTNEGG